jgi:hypothetical protein
MHTSQNEFGFYELSLHEKTNIIQNMAKNITMLIAFIFYHRALVKQDHYMTHLLSCSNAVLWCSCWKSAIMYSSTVYSWIKKGPKTSPYCLWENQKKHATCMQIRSKNRESSVLLLKIALWFISIFGIYNMASKMDNCSFLYIQTLPSTKTTILR